MTQYIRLFLLVALLLLLSAGLVACEKERPSVVPSDQAVATPARGTVVPSPTPPAAVTRVTLPSGDGGEAQLATPIPAGAVTPTAPAPQPVVVSPAAPAEGGASSSQYFTYTVVSGDTLAAIAARFGVSQEAIVRLNELADPNALALGQKLKIPGAGPSGSSGAEGAGSSAATTMYVVQRGDTLASIARRFGTTVSELARLNNLTNPDVLGVGQQLVVPAGGAAQPSTGGTSTAGQQRSYIVQQGDTLLKIAQRFGITVQQLQAANPGVQNPDRIYPGQVLVIP